MWRKQNTTAFFKTFLVLVFMSGSINIVFASGNATFEFDVNLSYPQGDEPEPDYDGSSLFKKCQSMLSNEQKWKDITTNRGSDKIKIWENAWNRFGYEQQRKLDDLSGDDPDDLLDFYTQFNSKLKTLQRDIAKCETMRSLTKGTDFTDSDSLKSGKASAKQSVDGKIKCVSAGPETQDYKACLKALNIYNGALVGTAVFTQIQTVKYQGDSMEAISGLDPNDPTAGLKAQKNDIEGRARITGQRAGLDVAKAGGLWATMESIIDHDDLNKRCTSDASAGRISYDHIRAKATSIANDFYNLSFSETTQNGSTVVKLTVNHFNTNDENPEIPGYSNTSSPLAQGVAVKARGKYTDAHNLVSTSVKITKYCNESLKRAPELLVNQSARQGLKNAMIAAGIDGVKHKLTADQLNKQANQVGKIIDEVNKFNPEELPQFQGQDFQGSECDLDPSAEGCDDFVQERSFGFQDRGPLQIHGMENASNFRRGEEPEGTSRDDSAAGSSPNRSGAPKPIGIFDDKVAKKSGFDGRMPGAADVSRDGPAPANGGGGGGGAAGGGGSPPPSQVPQQKQGEDGPRMSDAGNSRAAYGGGGGSLSRSGGRGAMGRGTQEEEGGNPFAELFGDEGPSNNTLNFRETASAENQINTPDTSIFDIISDRYVNVQKQDRLLEYKVQDPGELQ